MNRRVFIDEPRKRQGPVQCINCQEFDHTKSYCKLQAVCVICAELHNTADCRKPKGDKTCRKCSNCGENHTANFRGCPVYLAIKNRQRQIRQIPVETPTIYQRPAQNEIV